MSSFKANSRQTNDLHNSPPSTLQSRSNILKYHQSYGGSSLDFTMPVDNEFNPLRRPSEDENDLASDENNQSMKTRKINKIPFKVLDAPQLQDDFYLNLVDWSSQNVLAVGLNRSVYIWSACTS